jgi:hypothetical protein
MPLSLRERGWGEGNPLRYWYGGQIRDFNSIC